MNHFTMLNALLFVSLMAITQVWASPIEVQDAQKEAVKAWCSSYAQESQAHNALVARDTSPSNNPPTWGSPSPWRPPPSVWSPPVWSPPPSPWRPPPSVWSPPVWSPPSSPWRPPTWG